MIHNSGTSESSDRLALLRPSKCPAARTDQYPTGHLLGTSVLTSCIKCGSDDQFFPKEAYEEA
uniref:Uncharacterized protein n=1 Tax=Oryza punctata TaxID=4537 RepID=A0A0E0KLS0_ORYPU